MYLDSDQDYSIYSDVEEAAVIWERDFSSNRDGFDCKAADYYRGLMSKKHNKYHTAQSPAAVVQSNYVLVSGINYETGQFYFWMPSYVNELAITGYLDYSHIFNEESVYLSRVYDSGESAWFYSDSCLR